MAISPLLKNRRKRSNPSKQEKVDPVGHVQGLLSTPSLFAATCVLLLALYEWPKRWVLSGVPILTYCILLGALRGYRILSFIPLWTLLATLHVVYAVAATSWLLYWVFAVHCYPAIFLTCLFQFDFVADRVRRNLRSLLRQLQIVNDKIALFDIPALEIDTEVDGLMVVRGLTISLSSLTIIAHGVEVGIKLSDDMELALLTDTVTIRLFRGVNIGDVYANIKGGEYEMTFGNLEESTKDEDGDAVMETDTPLLKAAAANGDTSRPGAVKMTDAMTDGNNPKDSSPQAGLKSVTTLSPDSEQANRQYLETLAYIEKSSVISQARRKLRKLVRVDSGLDKTNQKDMRAAICSELHNKPSIPHPPRRSIKVTTLQNLSPPYVRRFLHRLPLLLRLLLNPLSYFHPLSVASVTAAGSGRWIQSMLGEHIFQEYGEDVAEIRRLEQRIASWLSDANFVLELAEITGLAQVPFLTTFDINCYLGFGDVMAYRTLPKEIDLKQVIRLGGADATFNIPSFLLPHHEHLLPPVPTRQDKQELEKEVEEADGLPKTIQAQGTLEQAIKDETNVKMSVHASLPACFDQELLNFIAALVKATKVVEMEKESNAMDKEVTGLRDFGHSLSRGMKDGMKKAVVGGIVNDQWIAKMVSKVTKKLETAQGDVGYSGSIPVALENYRLEEGHPELSKLLA